MNKKAKRNTEVQLAAMQLWKMEKSLVEKLIEKNEEANELLKLALEKYNVEEQHELKNRIIAYITCPEQYFDYQLTVAKMDLDVDLCFVLFVADCMRRILKIEPNKFRIDFCSF